MELVLISGFLALEDCHDACQRWTRSCDEKKWRSSRTISATWASTPSHGSPACRSRSCRAAASAAPWGRFPGDAHGRGDRFHPDIVFVEAVGPGRPGSIVTLDEGYQVQGEVERIG
jgi:hypothetical protein